MQGKAELGEGEAFRDLRGKASPNKCGPQGTRGTGPKKLTLHREIELEDLRGSARIGVWLMEPESKRLVWPLEDLLWGWGGARRCGWGLPMSLKTHRFESPPPGPDQGFQKNKTKSSVCLS